MSCSEDEKTMSSTFDEQKEEELEEKPRFGIRDMTTSIRKSTFGTTPLVVIFKICTFLDFKSWATLNQVSHWTECIMFYPEASPVAVTIEEKCYSEDNDDTLKNRLHFYRPSILKCSAKNSIAWLERHASTLTDLNLDARWGVTKYYSVLSTLTCLENFECDHTFSAKELPFVTCHTQLKRLVLGIDSKMDTLLPFSDLSRLQHLEIKGYLNDMNNIDAIRNMMFLETLKISSCSATIDLSPLSKCTRLTTLSLKESKFTDIGDLEHCFQLTDLNLSDCALVTSLDPLHFLANLTKLDISEMKLVTTLEPLLHLTQMRDLTIYQMSLVSSLEPIRYMTELENLNCALCERIPSLEPLRNMTHLESLFINCCIEIKNINVVKRFPFLTSLSFEHCPQIRDIKPLAKLENLDHLGMNGCNAITNLWPISNLTQLTSITIPEYEDVDYRIFDKLILLGIDDEEKKETKEESEPTHRSHSHPLVLTEVHNNNCNWCGGWAGNEAYRCAPCDYDLCKTCSVRLRGPLKEYVFNNNESKQEEKEDLAGIIPDAPDL